MASSNYMLCDNCGRKTIYIGEDEHPGFPIFCDQKCVVAYASRLAVSTVARDATPSDTQRSE